jgi:hypothetical protein
VVIGTAPGRRPRGRLDESIRSLKIRALRPPVRLRPTMAFNASSKHHRSSRAHAPSAGAIGVALGYSATRLDYSARRAVSSGRHASSPTNPGDAIQSEEWLKSDVATDSWRKTAPTKEKARPFPQDCDKVSIPRQSPGALATPRNLDEDCPLPNFFRRCSPRNHNVGLMKRS